MHVLKIVYALVAILFADSLSQTLRYRRDVHYAVDSAASLQLHASLFYAQRNLYLTGFTLLLSVILNRFLDLQMRVFAASRDEVTDAGGKKDDVGNDENDIMVAHAGVIERSESLPSTDSLLRKRK